MRFLRLLWLLPLLAAGAPAQKAASLTEEERIIHALSRLAFGPRPGQIAEVKKQGLEAWIAAQLEPSRIPDGPLRSRLSEYPALRMTPKELASGGSSQKARRQRRRNARRQLEETVVLRAAESRRQLLEVLVDFWRNHFNVDVAKQPVDLVAIHYEEAVLRRHALGRFEDLLMATARHPAMLIYLDNHLSRRRPTRSEINALKNRVRRQTGSKERAAQRAAIAEQTGLNENYARELMELHTLGVDNGYTQKDVIEVARAFTGWTIDRSAGPDWFVFREDMHESGLKQLMGRDLPLGRREGGIIEGETIIKRLARHKNTSEFIARKLCRRLVADDPPKAVVQKAAAVFRRTGGDIRAVVQAIVTHPDFFSEAAWQTKFKTPFEFVISALRATNARIDEPRSVVKAIADLGQPVYNCEDPTGYSDAAEAWRDPGVMALRWSFAMRLVEGRIKGVSIPAAFYDGLPQDLLKVPEALARRILPQGMGRETSRVLERVLFREARKAGAPEKINRERLCRMLVGILLGSPEFQQQ